VPLRPLEIALGVEPLRGDAVARVVGELPEERPLRPAVALAERMDRVQLGVVVGDSVHEPLAREAVQKLLAGHLGEDAA